MRIDLSAPRHDIERWSRQLTQQVYMGDNTALCRVLGDLMMYVDTRDLSLAPHMLMNGFWETWVTRAVAMACRPGATVVDVGANCGYFTLLMADLVGPTGHVVAIEPNPRQCELLHRSLDVNGFLDRVVLVQAAAAAEPAAEVWLEIPKGHSGSARVGGSQVWIDPVDILAVRAVTIDSLLRSNVSVVKNDVEGGEIGVWVGMEELWQKNPELVACMEWRPEFSREPDALPKFLLACGARVRQVMTDGSIGPIDIEEAKTHATETYMLWVDHG